MDRAVLVSGGQLTKVGRALALFVLIAAWRVPCGWAGEAAPLGRFDYLPYPVSVSVAFSRDSEITEAFRHSVCSSLAARLEQTFGAVFNFPSGTGVRPNEQLSAADESGLDDLTYSSAAEYLSGAACEKAYFAGAFPMRRSRRSNGSFRR
jgi:hypothetical protein